MIRPNTIVYIDLPPYLVQWYKHALDCPKTIRLPRNSVETSSIFVHLRKRLKDEMDPEPMTDSYVEIEIPKFRDIDWERYCMLTEEGYISLKRIIRARFKDAVYRDLFPLIVYQRNLTTDELKAEKQEIITRWMKISGIEENETNFRSVLKVFDRLRANFRERAIYGVNKRFEKLRKESARKGKESSFQENEEKSSAEED